VKALPWALVSVLALAVLVAPVLPCIDFPQHLAIATQLRRLWDGDPFATATFTANLATHNAGIAVFTAALGKVMPIELGGRLFFAAYPPLLMAGVLSLLRARGLPAWRALLILPATLSFAFAWGFVNFCVGTALAWLAVAVVVKQLDELTLRRALGLSALSIVLGATHVMAMLLCALIAGGVGIEHLARTRTLAPRALARVGLAGAPLALGCAYDLAVYFAHVAHDAGSYTSSPGGFDTFSPLRKVAWFGTLVAGMYRTLGDTMLAWFLVALLVAMAIVASTTRAHEREAGRPLIAPFLVTLAFYFAIPSVFANTHLIFQRTASWVVIAAVVAIPGLPDVASKRFSRVGAVLAIGATSLFPVHLALLAHETRGLDDALAAVPKGALLTGYMEASRTAAFRATVLSHVAALAVPRGAADEGFSFARLLGTPVVYRREKTPPYPNPTWEHGGHDYRVDDPLARAYPVLLVRLAWPDEPTEGASRRLFGAKRDRVKLLARSGAWAVWDTAGVSAN
jgi:hypothetical protein